MPVPAIIRKRKLLATAAAAALAHGTALAEEVAPKQASPTRAEARAIDVPLSLNGFYLGDISAQVSSKGEFEALDVQRLAALLTDRADSKTLEQILNAAGTARYVPAQSVSFEGFAVSFDTASLQVAVTMAANRTPVQEISMGSSSSSNLKDVIQPSGVSGALNFNFARHWVQKSKLDPESEGLEPLTASIDGYFNIGGLDGLYLYHQWSYDGGRSQELQRGPMTLVRDFVGSGIRLLAGDISPPTTYFQGATQLAGIQIGTAYSEIQPNRNIRPAGHTDFVLDRTSRIDVEVNDVVTRTLTLTAGRYDLRDLALSEGANNVRLIVEDASGRRELLAFSGLFASELLAKGLTEFSIAAGIERTPSRAGYSYHTGRPKLIGFIKRGLTDTFTGGANLQVGGGVLNAGGDLIAALPIGTVSAQLSGSSAYGKNGFAAATAFRHARDWTYPTEVELLWRYRSVAFRGLDELDIRNDTGHELSASLRQSLPSNIYASAGASYAISRTRPDPLRYSLSIGRPFGKVLANLFVEKSRRLDGRAETSAVASLSIRFGSRSSIRAQYRSRTNEKLIEYERSIYNGVGEWGARTGFNSSSSGTSFQGNVDLYANRGELGLRTGVVESINGNQVIDSTLRGAFGLAFAGGEFAVGRPVYEGFAILKRHRSLRRNRVSVPAGMFSGGSLATTDLFGPALVPLTRGYQVQQFDVSVDELPVGYDAGASRFTVLTGARAGMALTVGSDAVNSVLGTLTYPDGEPVRLVAGVLRRRGSDTSGDVEFFTNRTGRFAAEKLRPGIYSIIVSKVDTGASLTIPEDADGLVQTGKITVERQ